MPVPASCPAIRAWVQAVTPSGGTGVAAATICSRTSGPYSSGRPLRGLSHRAGMPPRANRRRQVRTVPSVQPSSAAIRAFGQFAWASSAILVRRTSACGEDGRRTIASSLALRRDPEVTMSLLAARAMTCLRGSAMITRECPEQDQHWRRRAAPGGNEAMPVPSRRLKELIEGTVDHHASQRWPALEEVTISWRGSCGYLTGYLSGSDDGTIKLCRIQYPGDDDDWAFAIWQASSDSYAAAVMLDGSFTGHPNQALDTACTLYLADIGDHMQ